MSSFVSAVEHFPAWIIVILVVGLLLDVLARPRSERRPRGRRAGRP